MIITDTTAVIMAVAIILLFAPIRDTRDAAIVALIVTILLLEPIPMAHALPTNETTGNDKHKQSGNSSTPVTIAIITIALTTTWWLFQPFYNEWCKILVEGWRRAPAVESIGMQTMAAAAGATNSDGHANHQNLNPNDASPTTGDRSDTAGHDGSRAHQPIASALRTASNVTDTNPPVEHARVSGDVAGTMFGKVTSHVADNEASNGHDHHANTLSNKVSNNTVSDVSKHLAHVDPTDGPTSHVNIFDDHGAGGPAGSHTTTVAVLTRSTTVKEVSVKHDVVEDAFVKDGHSEE